MKLAITGKGGVGKTTLSAGLSVVFAERGRRVIAVDADPDANLAATLDFPHPDRITPVAEMTDLIEERTGVRPGGSGALFSLNPRVDDIPDECGPEHRGIRLLALGGYSRQGGSGCFCPESALLRSLLAHLLFERDDVVILDMEAGLESFTRGTARGVDGFLVVVEPGRRSLETASRIRKLALDLGIERVWAVANKVRSEEDRQFIAQGLDGMGLLAALPYRTEVIRSGMGRQGIREALDGPLGGELRRLQFRLEEEFAPSTPRS